MKKVYIITAGSYSDYRIVGVFDSKGLAKKFIEIFDPSHYCEIEEHELNPRLFEMQNGYKSYSLIMDKDGNSSGIEQLDGDSYDQDMPTYGFGFGKGPAYLLWHKCFAKDENHAIKITNELRTRLIAENKWPEPAKNKLFGD